MKIGIIGAMEEEVTLLRDKIENRQTITIGGSEIYTGQLHGVDVALLKSGIGKVAAAMGATLLLERCQPDVIINTGSAGGHQFFIRLKTRRAARELAVFIAEGGDVGVVVARFIGDDDIADLQRRRQTVHPDGGESGTEPGTWLSRYPSRLPRCCYSPRRGCWPRRG